MYLMISLAHNAACVRCVCVHSSCRFRVVFFFGAHFAQLRPEALKIAPAERALFDKDFVPIKRSRYIAPLTAREVAADADAGGDESHGAARGVCARPLTLRPVCAHRRLTALCFGSA